MIDLERLEEYRENNRIEAKLALGGLPQSIWETYSAFANTLGGILLLGVAEYPDHSLHPVDLPDPEQLIAEFWTIVNDERRVSANILRREDVAVHLAEGKHIVAICVPMAPPEARPVYIGGDPLLGTYRRDGEGDIRCSPAEVRRLFARR